MLLPQLLLLPLLGIDLHWLVLPHQVAEIVTSLVITDFSHDGPSEF
jgi:hypothetical protein